MNKIKYIILAIISLSCANYYAMDLDEILNNKNVDLAKELIISKKVNVSECGKHGYYPIHTAVNIGAKEIVELLIKEKVDVNIQDTLHANTPLIYAVARSNQEIVKLLVEAGASVNETNKHGATALFHTFYTKDLEIIRYLISNGADINKPDNKGSTLVGNCCSLGKLDLIALLFELGANFNVIDGVGQPAIYLAAMTETNSNKQGLVKYLVEQGVDINIKNKKGDTPLHKACFWGQSNIVKLLIHNGANVTIKNNMNDDPITVACKKINGIKRDDAKRPYQQIIELIKGRLLDMIVRSGNIESTVLLIKENLRAALNYKNNKGETILHIAVAYCSLDMIKNLFALLPALRNIRNDVGQTPIMLAALTGPEILNIFMQVAFSFDADWDSVYYNTIEEERPSLMYIRKI